MVVRGDWVGRSDYLRLRVQRLLQLANGLVTGGYRDLQKVAGMEGCGIAAGEAEEGRTGRDGMMS